VQRGSVVAWRALGGRLQERFAADTAGAHPLGRLELDLQRAADMIAVLADPVGEGALQFVGEFAAERGEHPEVPGMEQDNETVGGIDAAQADDLTFFETPRQALGDLARVDARAEGAREHPFDESLKGPFGPLQRHGSPQSVRRP
jgi:hypothetical protein